METRVSLWTSKKKSQLVVFRLPNRLFNPELPTKRLDLRTDSTCIIMVPILRSWKKPATGYTQVNYCDNVKLVNFTMKMHFLLETWGFSSPWVYFKATSRVYNPPLGRLNPWSEGHRPKKCVALDVAEDLVVEGCLVGCGGWVKLMNLWFTRSGASVARVISV